VLKLYYTAHTCWLATHIVLEEVGADYSTVRAAACPNARCEEGDR
jgi:hypothetical protein